ncbi:MAG: hypothetical protein WB995_15790 [Candidatus Acidiferrales bacterium]
MEVLLLARTIRTNLFAKFPVFYTYVLFVLLQSVVRFTVYHWYPQRYRDLYWLTEFVGVVVGCGVLFEIYRRGLAPYPGTARLARNVLALVFVFAAGKALAGAVRGGLWLPSRTTAELERNLRAAQAFAILGLVILLLAYSIPLGRNLRGILVGYGLFIATNLADLAMLASPGNEFQRLWSYSQQAFYLVVLCIWAVSLWTPSPQPGLASRPEVAPSYEEAERKTRDRLKRIRILFGRKKDR